MPYDSEAQKLAIKAIGTVESGLNYRSINYNDPITVGFMQWFGTRAAGLLGRIRAENPGSWVGVPASLTTALDTYPASDGYWPDRYLSREEGEPLRDVLNQNKAIQNGQAITDMEAYKVSAIRAGMNPDTNTDAVIFFFSMYHQSPRRALGVVASAGPNSSLDRLLAVCLNEPVLGQYRTRYTTVASIIRSGDTSGIGDVPDDPTDDGELPGGDTGGTGLTPPGGTVRYVSQVGDSLHIKFADGHTLTAVPNGRGYWIPSKDGTLGAPVPSVPDAENPNPGAPASELQNKLVEFVTSRIGRYAYSQGPSRLTPEANMYTDCSALMYYTFQSVMGKNIGTYTGNQWDKGTLVAKGSNTVDESLLQPGDLIFYNWTGGRSTVDHVEMYIGNAKTCGHGGPMNGPITKDLAGGISRALDYVVRRHAN